MALSKKCTLIVNDYNQAKQLDLLLESALKQTEQDFEIIVADDGSSDSTPEIVKQWASTLKVRHVWHEDRGFYRTIILNSAAKIADSDYLIFVDGDMILHHRFIEMHLKHAHPQRVMCGWRGSKIKEALTQRLIDKKETFSTETPSVLWRGLKGHGVCLNTSLNRRGEPMVCSPTDALNMLYGSDLQFLIMENILVKKPDAPSF